MASDPNQPQERNHVEAKQGTQRPNLIYVLAAGTVLVIVLFFVVWLSTRGSQAPT